MILNHVDGLITEILAGIMAGIKQNHLKYKSL